MDHTVLKARADSLTNTHNDMNAARTSTQSHSPRHSVLRNVPIDPQYSLDLSHEIQRAWSPEITCSPDHHADRHPPPSPPSIPPPHHHHRRKPLSAHLSDQSSSSLHHALTARPINPQTASPFFAKLPPEIRDQVYTHLLTYPGVILCVADGGLPPSPPAARYGLAPAILRTCRRAALDATGAHLYGGRNRFSVAHIPNVLRSRAAPPRFVLWPRCFALVRHLNVDVPDKHIERWYRTDWGGSGGDEDDCFESYTAITGALVSLAAAPRGRGCLRHLQLSLVRNCALESYTSWSPYVAAETPLMRAVARDFLPGVLGEGERRSSRGARFLLVVPCGYSASSVAVCGGGGGSGGGSEAQRAFDVLRPDAPAVVHAVARSLGTLQKTAKLNGLRLEESLRVVVREKDGDAGGSSCGELRTEIWVDEENACENGGTRGITLEVAY